jgi:tetratricopeptide (TPR) repeat protein
MMTVRQAIALLGLWSTMVGAPAFAITGLDDPPEAPVGAVDYYSLGLAAHERGDWRAVINHMVKAIEQKPWHADAYNLSGFAWRKLGDYDRALVLYDKALELNPHHRGALEYLGEAYLELDRPDDAGALLQRLATECQRVADGADWQADCEEWHDLKAAYDAYQAGDSQAATTQ